MRLPRPLIFVVLIVMLSAFSGSATAHSEADPSPSVAPLSSFVGRPIVAVDIEAPAHESVQSLLELIDIQPGYLLERPAVQEAIERLYALGRFAQIEARVSPLQGAISLHFLITPLVRLESLKVSGLKNVQHDAFVAELGLNIGDEVGPDTPQTATAQALEVLSNHGYPLAQCQTRCLRGPSPDAQRCELTVREGPAHRVAQVLWTGSKQIPKGILQPLLKTRPKAVLSKGMLEADRTRLLDALHAHGFLRAQVAAPKVVQGYEGAQVTFGIQAHERLTFRYVGNHVLGDAALLALWPASLGGAPKQMLGLYRQRLTDAYNKEGYPNARIHVRLRGRAHSLRKRIDVHVQEGSPLWIDGLHFVGTQALPKDILHEQVHAVLLADLTPANFFGPMSPGDWALRGAPQTPLARVPHKIPPQHRWIPELYQRAADDIAAAYRDLGFLNVSVAPPTFTLRRDDAQAQILWSQAVLHEAEPLFGDVTPLENVPSGRYAPQIPPKVEAATATFHVQEGNQYFIDSISFTGNRALGASQLLKAVHDASNAHPLVAPISPGAPLSYASIEDGRIGIVRQLRDQGFLYARVFSRVELPHDSVFAHVHYAIEEGPAVHVQRLLVRGNRHTREGVIRSRITLRPGALYKLNQAIIDQREILALGTFSAVRVRLVDEEHPGDRKDVVADVEESPRQLIEVTPGLSTTQGVRLKASYSHINVLGTAAMFVASAKVNRQVFFDLYGGYADKLRTRYHGYRGLEQLTRAVEREVRVGLRSPPIKYFPGDPLLRLDVVDQRINAVRYGLDATTATLGADVTAAKRLKLSLEVQGGITELECPLGNNCDQDLDVRRLRGGRPIQQGTLHTIKFGPMIHWEGRDDPISPSKGYYAYARVTQAFGSAQSSAAHAVSTPFAFLKWEGVASTYVAAYGQVLAISARVGSIAIERSLVPVDERFFLGGRDTLRGFVETTLIPQDACVVQDPNAPLPKHCAESIAANPAPPLSLGGNTYALLKTELRIPLKDRFSLDLFADIGNLWVDLRRAPGFALRVGTGAGLRYATPVGALTVDAGINTSPRKSNGEPDWQLHFSIGSF
jgi:outer membrane protein assembly factor BamA